ncbi:MULTISPECIES: maltokinase N-terminal cap-like domain-containing protein [Actinoalloteichus]|uniref:Maltokinase n=1 Tax=Actinoalloteichus fjordicus TaxID=1612552 RepID=A0AAC9LAW8_9PSEU|nr:MULTISPECIES: phosphotransferase [Actinoalloteichus]APU13569.1 maltokinase [Actinoalloteichus fjordicus]APU19516.1 maltokinase [Actinoalloteichus sp. GBA129-24]
MSETTSTPWPQHLEQALAGWLPWQRWFASKGTPIERISVASCVELVDDLDEGGPRGLLLVAAVHFVDAEAPELYQVPLGIRRSLPAELESSVIAALDDVVVYDALDDASLCRVLLTLIGRGAEVAGVRFVAEPIAGFSAANRSGLTARRMTSEQSNTSVVFADRYILKVFRRLAEGVNPDLELHRALRQVRSSHLATLLGSIEGSIGGRPVTYAMLQTFAANSAEGWSMATASVRDLLAVQPCAPPAAGGDFTPEAFRLGAAVAEVHADLATAFGTTTLRGAELRALSEGMSTRLAAALPQVPALAPYAALLRRRFAEVADLPGGVQVQRVHGDLHLGQVLRAPTRWLLIDFEGEPSASIAQRTETHSPLRDVAGMMRSFDYAAQHHLRSATPQPGTSIEALRDRAAEWAAHNRAAFCRGYADVAGFDPIDQHVLLTAYELEKAVYEAVYETRSRPDWLDIPLRAVRELTGLIEAPR